MASTSLILGVTFITLAALPAGAQETVVYSFQGGSDGAYPLAALVADRAGHLYGTTQGGGGGTCTEAPTGGCGTVFELTPPAAPGGAWVENVIYQFGALSDGANPWSGLILDQQGNLYGTAEFGGPSGNGTVFELTPPTSPGGAWTQTILHSFQGLRHNSDGANPQGSLVFDGSGNLFGTTYAGGIACSDSAPSGCGTIFELMPPATAGGAWIEKVLYRFDPYLAGGPAGTLIFDAEGSLYGTAVNDGHLGEGTAYKLTPSASGDWTRTVLHTFGGPTDGGYVYAGLIFGPGGVLYGATTGYGGEVGNGGAVFQLTPPSAPGGAWTETLNVFPEEDGYAEGPWGSPLAGPDGALYGTTSSGGEGSCTWLGWHGCGFVFKLTPPAIGGVWTGTTLYRFAGGSDGGVSRAGLIWGPGHKLYGTTSGGGGGPCPESQGLAGCGTVFEITP